MSGPAREGPLGDGSANLDSVAPMTNGRSIRLSDRLALRPEEEAAALGVSERTLRKRWCEERQVVKRPGLNNSTLIRLATSADRAAEAAEGAVQ